MLLFIIIFAKEFHNVTLKCIILNITRKRYVILRSFTGPTVLTINFMVTTNSHGMGIRVKDYHGLIIHGPSILAVCSVYETGSLRRDPQPSLLILLYHGLLNKRFV